ncbi:hypothetical protein ACF0H5_016143 [Mactra antiquata]
MSLTRNLLFSRGHVCRCVTRLLSSEAGSTDTPATGAPEPKQPSAQPSTPTQTTTVSSDNTKYQCGMYYSYNDMSFYDIEIAMSEKRVGQPSSKTK